MANRSRVWLANLLLSLALMAGSSGCQPLPETRDTPAPTRASSAIAGATPPAASGAAIAPTADGVTGDGSPRPSAVTPEPSGALPATWVMFGDDFESGSLARWGKVSEANLRPAPGQGRGGSTGLSATVQKGESYVNKGGLPKAGEGYLTFWFNPNGVAIPDPPESKVPGKSIRIADVKGSQKYEVLVALRVRRPAGQGYRAYLEWQGQDGSHFDNEAGEFELVDGWQKITLGYRLNAWVAVWLNDARVRKIDGVTHSEPFASSIELGKANDDNNVTPSGALRYDDIAFQIPRIADLWVDAANGNDERDGRTRANAFRTIQKAADLAGPGTTVHILPGVYRETVQPALDGSAAEPVLYKAEAGPGTAIIRGSVPARDLAWTRLTANTIGLPAQVDPMNIYSADLSAWKLADTPRFVVALDGQGAVSARLPLAREPDWTVATAWKYHEFWWTAEGGATPAACNPAADPNPNCDAASRSSTQLTDRSDDAAPAGIEPGNLTTLGDLSGATLVAADTVQGHYIYRRIITAHNAGEGRVIVDRRCEHDPGSGNPGLGWGTKYYVENKPSLLDTPGEWWYDKNSGRLYLWPPAGQDPAQLAVEIARRDVGFNLARRSYVALDGLALELFNDSAVKGYNDPGDRSFGDTVRGVTLRYANYGVYLFQNVDDAPGNITSGFTLAQSEIAFMDTDALSLAYAWRNDSAPASFTHAGIEDSLIQGNDLHDLGFRSDLDSALGVSFAHADRLRFIDNHVHDIAHNGVQFSWSVIQSPKQYGFTSDEIKTGEILVQNNTFERACQAATDCGGLKFWGDPPAGHVFRDVLVTGNVFRDTLGWSYVGEQRKHWNGGPASEVRGMGGFGLYLDMVSGIAAYRNIAYNNAYAGYTIGGAWRDGPVLFYNNIAANSLYGFFVSGLEFDTHGSTDTQLAGNLLLNNEGYGIWTTAAGGAFANTLVDYNQYYANGWRSSASGGMEHPGAMLLRVGQDTYRHYQLIDEIRLNTPWEAHGREGNPGLPGYNVDEHSLAAGGWSDLRIDAGSDNVLGRGAPPLPAALTTLLAKFGVAQ